MTLHSPSPASLPRPLWRVTALLMVLVAMLFFGAAARADELSEVQRLHLSGQTAEALKRADAFLATKPKDPQMRFVKGVMLADTRRNEEAVAIFQKLTEDYPDLAEPYNNLAALYASTGDYDKARSALEQALRTNPVFAAAHENLGDVYAMLASQSYSQALRLDPANVTVPPKLALVREMFAGKTRPAPMAAASASVAR